MNWKPIAEKHFHRTGLTDAALSIIVFSMNHLPERLYSDRDLADGKRRVLEFVEGEMELNFGIIHRLEFTDKRCNVTLRNTDHVKHSVNVKVYVLNSSLIEIWQQSEKWLLTSLQPDQVHLVSWEFKPAVPSVVWNLQARDNTPAWIVVDVD